MSTFDWIQANRSISFLSYSLSHKRSTGQGIAGRLFEGLKDKFKVFLDSEAKFKIHNLRKIVENTEAFVFILTHGILLSTWCLEELKSALDYKKKVIIINNNNHRRFIFDEMMNKKKEQN